MPSDTGDSCHRLELMHDVARDEVNVVVSQLDASVADAFPVELVQLGIFNPSHTLKHTSEIYLPITICQKE